MGKKIALFIDGTANSPDADYPTNVEKLHAAADEKAGPYSMYGNVPVAKPGSPQVAHYMRGVGTGGKFDQFFGGVFGFGSAEKIREAYLFLAKNYTPGDQVYLFGFSRGAFAARAMANFVGIVGLAYAEDANPDSVARAYELYEHGVKGGLTYQRLEIAPQEPIPIHLIGLWDTVAAQGFQAAGSNVWNRHHIHPMLPGHISHARHALALHDLRPEFEPTLWEEWESYQSMEQVWFAGAHSDVGGSYPNTQLSDVPLAWMARESKDLGLLFSPLLPQQQAWNGKVHYAEMVRSLEVRKALREWNSPSKSRLRESYSFHASAARQLANPAGTRFRFDEGSKPKMNQQQQTAAFQHFEHLLDRADQFALDLLLSLPATRPLVA